MKQFSAASGSLLSTGCFAQITTSQSSVIIDNLKEEAQKPYQRTAKDNNGVNVLPFVLFSIFCLFHLVERLVVRVDDVFMLLNLLCHVLSQQ